MFDTSHGCIMVAGNSRDTMASSADGPEQYRRLLDRYRQISNLEQASSYLEWDQRVMMPLEGTEGRAKQLSAISRTIQDLWNSETLEECLTDINRASLDEKQCANIREISRRYERAVRVPSELTGQITEQASENRKVWSEAKKKSEYGLFAPKLAEIRDLQVQRAESINDDVSPYHVMFEDTHPYLDLERVETIFDTIRDEVPEIVETIRSSDVKLATVEQPTDEDAQREICERALEFLGYDWSRGRLDVSSHRFMTGTQFDARVTTRFNETDPLDPITGTIHEFGHATYQHGLTKTNYGTPLGESHSSIHESQSRFWENHIARTKSFWEAFLPIIDDIEGFDVTPHEAYQAVNQIHPNNLIRVEADELTYHLHILLRAELGRKFIEGELDVAELPRAWNDRMEEYLGVRPQNDAEGCLQDVHWTERFAAFQTYTIGSVFAAQLNSAMRQDLDVDALVREGRFDPIHDWLERHIHSHGKRYTPPELIEKVTGSPLSADAFLEYIKTKYSNIYGVNLH